MKIWAEMSCEMMIIQFRMHFFCCLFIVLCIGHQISSNVFYVTSQVCLCVEWMTSMDKDLSKKTRTLNKKWHAHGVECSQLVRFKMARHFGCVLSIYLPNKLAVLPIVGEQKPKRRRRTSTQRKKNNRKPCELWAHIYRCFHSTCITHMYINAPHRGRFVVIFSEC